MSPRENVGYLPFAHFRTPELLAKYPEELLYFVAPDKIGTEDHPALVIFLHGGTINRDNPHFYLNRDDLAAPELLKTSGAPSLLKIFSDYRLVTVAPSIFPNVVNGWCRPECEGYLADLVQECIARFSVDPNRVFLIGFSMGGGGAFHISQAWPDRYAGIMAMAGAWKLALWKNLLGTPFWVCHGAKDGEYRVRGRFTDVQYARLCDRLMTGEGVPHNYLEHEGGHILHEPSLRKFLTWAESARRDIRPRRVFMSTPAGWYAPAAQPVDHRFWISVEETTAGRLRYHACVPDQKYYGGHRPEDFDFTEEEWESWQLRYEPVELDGAQVEATYESNRFLVSTRNVGKFTVWFDEQMVDLRKPVLIECDGKDVFSGAVAPSAATMRESFALRRDHGMRYSGKISVALEV